MQRDFIYQGFNRDVAGRKVFDGMNPIVGGGRRRFVNYRFAQPGRTSRQHEDHLFPMAEFPFTYGTTTDVLSGKAGGLFARCSPSNTRPDVIDVDTDMELDSGHASLVLTDTRGRAADLPPNVRYYYVTTAHLQGSPGAVQPPAPGGCRDEPNAISPYPTTGRHMMRSFDGSATARCRLRQSAVGRRRTFVTVAEQHRGYPAIPGKPHSLKINELVRTTSASSRRRRAPGSTRSSFHVSTATAIRLPASSSRKSPYPSQRSPAPRYAVKDSLKGSCAPRTVRRSRFHGPRPNGSAAAIPACRWKAVPGRTRRGRGTVPGSGGAARHRSVPFGGGRREAGGG